MKTYSTSSINYTGPYSKTDSAGNINTSGNFVPTISVKEYKYSYESPGPLIIHEKPRNIFPKLIFLQIMPL